MLFHYKTIALIQLKTLYEEAVNRGFERNKFESNKLSEILTIFICIVVTVVLTSCSRPQGVLEYM